MVKQYARLQPEGYEKNGTANLNVESPGDVEALEAPGGAGDAVALGPAPLRPAIFFRERDWACAPRTMKHRKRYPHNRHSRHRCSVHDHHRWSAARSPTRINVRVGVTPSTELVLAAARERDVTTSPHGDRLAQVSKERPHIINVKFRFFTGGKVPTPRHHGESGQVIAGL